MFDFLQPIFKADARSMFMIKKTRSAPRSLPPRVRPLFVSNYSFGALQLVGLLWKIYIPLITLVDTGLTQEARQHPSYGLKRLYSVHTDHHACQRSVRVRRRKRCKQARCCGNERLRGELGNQNNAVWRFMIHFNAAVYSAILLNFQAAWNVYNCYFEPFTRIKWHTIRFWPSLFLQTDSSGSDWEIEKASAAGFIPIDPGMK